MVENLNWGIGLFSKLKSSSAVNCGHVSVVSQNLAIHAHRFE